MKRKPSSRKRAGDTSVRERAYLHIQRKLASGELRAGSAVSELTLAKELGSSRTPIREALGQLVAEGLLEQTPNRGTIVVQFRRQDIVDLYELREALEVFAAGKAATSPIRDNDLKRLQSLADETLALKTELESSAKTALDAEQMHRFMAQDLAFHAMLMRLAANQRILKLVNETRLLIRIFAMPRSGHDAQELEKIHRVHCDIVQAVATRNSERVRRLLSEHIQTSCQERLDAYDYWEREASLRESLPMFFDTPASQ